MAGGSEDKTLPASPKKLRDARKKGQVAKSRDLVSAAVTLAGFGFVVMQWDNITARLIALIDRTGEVSGEPLGQALPVLLSQIGETAAMIIAPLFLFLVMAVLLSSVVSTGGLVLSLDPLLPKIQKLNPAQGIKNIVSVKGLIEVIKSLFKLALGATGAASVIRDALQSLVDLPSCGLGCAGSVLHGTMLPLAVAGILVFVVFGVADLLLQRWLFLREQRMSHTEKKNEHKNSEGNPMIRSAHRRERREASMTRAGLSQATFLVSGARIAVALRYSATDTRVPMPVARAEADDVTPFLQEGRRLGLPTMHDPQTARALFDNVAIGHTIPRELFQPVIMCMKHLGLLSG